MGVPSLHIPEQQNNTKIEQKKWKTLAYTKKTKNRRNNARQTCEQADN